MPARSLVSVFFLSAVLALAGPGAMTATAAEHGSEHADHDHDNHDEGHDHGHHEDGHHVEGHGDGHHEEDHHDEGHDTGHHEDGHRDEGHDHGHHDEGHDHADKTTPHVSMTHGVRILHAWTRATQDDAVMVWLELQNRANTAVTLTGAASPIAEEAAIVGFRMAAGEGRHDVIEALPLEAGAQIAFTPFGLGIRLTGLSEPLPHGSAFEMELETDRGDVPFWVVVEAAGATQHSHAGHMHE